MPGIVVFRRRWSVGSDDLVVPTIFMIIMHVTWLITLAIVRGVVRFTPGHECTSDLRNLILGHLVILSVCIVLEAAIAFISTRGSILIQAPRASIEYLLYARLILGLVELGWLITGAVWASEHYTSCSPDSAKRALLGVMVCNWLMVLLLIICLWCTFDSAGAKWVKMKKFQDSIRERRQNNPRRGTNRRQSGSRRNWRQSSEEENERLQNSRRSIVLRQFFSRRMRRMRRKAFRAYEESWDRRLQLLCCCVERKGHNRNSMSEIAALFTDFFRDLDVVPSDIVAGLVLLRKYQKQRMNSIICQGSNDVYQFLSGVPVTPQTRFLQLSQPDVMGDFQRVTHYMRFALAVYGWPVYVMMHPGTWCCRLMPLFRCCCSKKQQNVEIVDDNCCQCNYNTAFRIRGLHDFDLVYCTYHVDIGETPFFVALDHVYKKVVVAIRGTLSLQDVLTDLKAEPETLPLTPPRDDWQGHKGMVQAAVYIKKKLINDGILQMAWDRDEERETAKYELVLVGHSLGAGTAAILAILLKPDYPNLHCYAYSPPGGLLTLPCVEETKSYITSVVVGKDCVPRIGLPQLEMLRADILNHIKNTTDSKWKIISRGILCCNRYSDQLPPEEMLERDVTAHPSNSAIGLSAHLPLFPPGRMIHVVRSHPKDQRTTGIFATKDPIYQAIWANNGDFDEVLISPTMVNDHMPDNVLDALEKVVIRVAPEKPGHTLTEEQRVEMLNNPSCSSLPSPDASDTNNSHSHSHSQDDASQRYQACNNLRGADGAEGAQGGEILEEIEEQMNYGTSASPYHGRQEEDMVMAPLASPETLSVASGLSAIGAFSPSSSLMGRDLLRHSLQRCAQKQLDSPSEADIENAEEGKSRLIDLARGPSSESHKHQRSSFNKTSVNPDPEAGTRGDDYTVRMRSGNTICVKAEVVNEMVKQGERTQSVSSLSQTRPESVDTDSQPNTVDSSAVLEPSSHTHVAPLVLSRCMEPGQVQGSPEDTHTTSAGVNHSPAGHGKPSPPRDINLDPVGGENGQTLSPPGEYVCHSPLDQSNQHEYGHPNTYYTQAGVGYPTNAFHTPQRFHSFPSDDAQHLVEDLCQDDLQAAERDKVFDSNNVLLTNHTKMSVVNEQTEDEDCNFLPTDALISKQEVCQSSCETPPRAIPASSRKPPGVAPCKKIFKKAESDNCLIAGGKLSPRMRRSAEQDDIAHLCDALEVFESEEDKARLCQSVTTLLAEDQHENSDTISNTTDRTKFYTGDADPCSDIPSPSPGVKATTSALVPASGKRKTSSNQCVSFGGSVIIPRSQSGSGDTGANLNGPTEPSSEPDSETDTQDLSTKLSPSSHGEDSVFSQTPHSSTGLPFAPGEQSSPVTMNIPNTPTAKTVTANNLADILNDTDSSSPMLQETHL